MSADWVHIVITIGVIALMFAWVPFVNIICPPGWRSTEDSSSEDSTEKKQR